MEAALKELQAIYDNVLVHEWSDLDKKQFQYLLSKANRNSERNVRIKNLVKFIAKEPWGFEIEIKEAQDDFKANRESMSLDDIVNHDYTLYKEAWEIYSKQDNHEKEEIQRLIKQFEKEIKAHQKYIDEQKSREDVKARIRELAKKV